MARKRKKEKYGADEKSGGERLSESCVEFTGAVFLPVRANFRTYGVVLD